MPTLVQFQFSWGFNAENGLQIHQGDAAGVLHGQNTHHRPHAKADSKQHRAAQTPQAHSITSTACLHVAYTKDDTESALKARTHTMRADAKQCDIEIYVATVLKRKS